NRSATEDRLTEFRRATPSTSISRLVKMCSSRGHDPAKFTSLSRVGIGQCRLRRTGSPHFFFFFARTFSPQWRLASTCSPWFPIFSHDWGEKRPRERRIIMWRTLHDIMRRRFVGPVRPYLLTGLGSTLHTA